MIVLWIILGALALVILATVARALPKAPSRSAGPSGDAGFGPAALPALPEGAAERLGEAIRIPTVTYAQEGKTDLSRHRQFIEFVKSRYPLSAGKLLVKEFGPMGLLYVFPGSDPSLKPALYLAHFDVVPADNVAEWTHPPFSGVTADGFVWGRGSLDDKILLVSILEAAEAMLASGESPVRTSYFAFGGDEEIGGTEGARVIAAYLKDQGVGFEYVIDEGSVVAEGMLAFLKSPVALIGISEKGHVDFRITARGAGGHASMPPAKTAVGELSRAIDRLVNHPFPARLTYTVKGFFAAVSPYAGFGVRLLFRNLWLTSPLVKAVLSKGSTTNAMIRTSVAPTMLSGSDKENVLPEVATANVNVRVLPGETIAGTLGRIRSLVASDSVSVEIAWPEDVAEPQRESPTDGFGYRAIVAILEDIAPRAVAVPFLVMAATDSDHYAPITDTTYRFMPVAMSDRDLARLHGTDERVSLEDFARCVAFYRRLFTLGKL
jgi:carboxypeptidase PM20D1